MIAHADGASGIAGVMGGADSEISDDDDRRGARGGRVRPRLGPAHDAAAGAAHRGLEPVREGRRSAARPGRQSRGVRLLVELAGATLAPEPIDVHGELPEPVWIGLRPGRVLAVTGLDVSSEESATILERLGFAVERTGDGLRVRPPTWRALDVTREIDVVEEVARVHGLEHVPATLPSAVHSGGLSEGQLVRRRLHEALLGAGCTEVQTMSLVTADLGDRLGLVADDPRREQVVLMNPLSAEHAALRTLLLPSLAEVAVRNQSLGRADMQIYEIAHVYHPRAGAVLPDEPWTLGALVAGGDASFFLAKGVAATVVGAVGIELEVEPGNGRDPFLHPGRAARIVIGGEHAGYLGELHPTLVERLGLSGPVAAFEIDVRLVEQHVPGPGDRGPGPRHAAASPGHRGRRARRVPVERLCWPQYGTPADRCCAT